ncbi:hypothetical protein GC176_19960 [bacterium]|nr:hypothetical protein [bacterium]
MKMVRKSGVLAFLVFAVTVGSSRLLVAAKPFVAVDVERGQLASIFLQFDADTGAGFDWKELSTPRLPAGSAKSRLVDAVRFLQEGIARMTGQTVDVRSDRDVSRGIVLLLGRNAPPELQADAFIQQALKNDGTDSYNHLEAFCIRSEHDRLLVMANTADGLIAAVPALLESVGYEVLGMGPNWIHVPRDRQRLVFNIESADRPSFYLRRLTPTSGQFYGVGTIMVGPKLQLTDPRDEPVSVSYPRWAIAIRDRGQSMAPFPGHALYAYHRPMIEHMLQTGSTEGFLTAGNHLGLDADRPAAAQSNASHLWINTDPKMQPGHGRVFLSDGKDWKEQRLVGMTVNLDTSAQSAREIVLAALKQRAESHFAELPDEVFVFGTEAEDGAGYQHIADWMQPEHRHWYPDYLKSIGRDWPQPYALHGYRGIDQPTEQWDYAMPADAVFAFNNWLLSEFDRWTDSLPEEDQVTSTGRSKKELVRCSLYSYAFHDIPPHFNLDPRIRVMIAGYPKHRGLGEWKNFASPLDVAAAFRKLLPREPSGEYRIISLAYYADSSLNGIPARWSAAPASILHDMKAKYDAGVRALNHEIDFNSGKYGLAYYLLSKVLWNVRQTPDELDALRDRWLQRAYGSGWQEMKAYYDFLLIDNFPANAPAAWARATRMIEAADAKIDPAVEPDEQRRLDDLKQYWYFYYLIDTGAMAAKSPEMIQFLWKGQMSYMTAMHMATRYTFPSGGRRLEQLLPEELLKQPAHYSAGETAVWWQKILDHWPVVEVDDFADATLADGRRGRDIDLNDLVRVSDFQSLTTGRPFLFNSAQTDPTPFVTVAREGETIGFRFAWPANETQLRFYGPKDVPVGIDYWDSESKTWDPVLDVTTTTTASHLLTETSDNKPRHVAEMTHTASRPGTYRIEVGRGGFLATLGSLGYDVARSEFSKRSPHTYLSRAFGLTQDPVYIYLPKGTRSLDLEVWDAYNRKQVQLYRGLKDGRLVPSRQVDVSSRGTHRVPLEPEETGTLAQISGNGFAFPLLYSVPSYWAKCPAELVIPRAIAEADGLLIVK